MDLEYFDSLELTFYDVECDCYLCRELNQLEEKVGSQTRHWTLDSLCV